MSTNSRNLNFLYNQESIKDASCYNENRLENLLINHSSQDVFDSGLSWSPHVIMKIIVF